MCVYKVVHDKCTFNWCILNPVATGNTLLCRCKPAKIYHYDCNTKETVLKIFIEILKRMLQQVSWKLRIKYSSFVAVVSCSWWLYRQLPQESPVSKQLTLTFVNISSWQLYLIKLHRVKEKQFLILRTINFVNTLITLVRYLITEISYYN